jgi:hypothetical protein
VVGEADSGEAAVNRAKELEAENADLSASVARLEEVDLAPRSGCWSPSPPA